jgi:hypothetical protein
LVLSTCKRICAREVLMAEFWRAACVADRFDKVLP